MKAVYPVPSENYLLGMLGSILAVITVSIMWVKFIFIEPELSMLLILLTIALAFMIVLVIFNAKNYVDEKNYEKNVERGK